VRGNHFERVGHAVQLVDECPSGAITMSNLYRGYTELQKTVKWPAWNKYNLSHFDEPSGNLPRRALNNISDFYPVTTAGTFLNWSCSAGGNYFTDNTYCNMSGVFCRGYDTHHCTHTTSVFVDTRESCEGVTALKNDDWFGVTSSGKERAPQAWLDATIAAKQHGQTTPPTLLADKNADVVPPGAAALGYTKAVIDEAPTAEDIAPNGTRTGKYKWFSGQWYAAPPSEYKYTTIDGVLALFLGGDLVSTAPGDMKGDGMLPLLGGADGFYVEFDVKLTNNDKDHWPAVWLMPIEHNGRQEDSPGGGQAGEPGDSLKFERWMELDVDEGGFGAGLTGTVHNWTGVYPKYLNTQNGNNVANATLDRTVYHTYGASYDPRTQMAAWWLDGVKLIETAKDVPTSEKYAKLAQKLGQLQLFIAIFP
jgi:hypothetical protein